MKIDDELKELKNDPLYLLEEAKLEFTEKVCELMEAQNVSRDELARRLNKRTVYVTLLLQGSLNYTFGVAVRTFHALGVDFKPSYGAKE